MKAEKDAERRALEERFEALEAQNARLEGMLEQLSGRRRGWLW